MAETLISLAIIGVIAALAIPSLLQNIQKGHLRTQWKVAYSIIDQANDKAIQDNNGNLTGIFQNVTDMKNKLKGYFIYTKECELGTSEGNCWPSKIYRQDGNDPGWGNIPGLELVNGMFVRFFAYTASGALNCNETNYYTTGECGGYQVDVNGFKGPNTLGEDIFFIHMLPDCTKPAGVTESLSIMSASRCSDIGAGCGAQYLTQ